MIKSYPITPVAKPRMVHSDKWKKRPSTTKYWEFKKDVRKLGIKLQESGFSVLFLLPMPKSWSQKKKREMYFQPHQQVPDVDNLMKSLFDSVLDNDCRIWDVRAAKRWGMEGAILIDDGEEE